MNSDSNRNVVRSIVGLLAVIMLVSGCTSDDRTSLIVYSPHGKEMLRAYEDAFELAHPDVDIRWIDMG